VGDLLEIKNMTAHKVPKSMFCRYNANFKLMAIKHAKATNNYGGEQKFHVTQHNVQRRRKQNYR
jgi:hypothetical protein